MDIGTAVVLARELGPFAKDIFDRMAGPGQPPQPTKFYLSRNRNARHPLVRRLQSRLKELGYDVVPDGIYGPSTQAAVAEHQARSGLLADGVAGADTLAAVFVDP